MLPFNQTRYDSTVVVHAGTYAKGALGGTVPSYADGGTTMAAYVEEQTTDAVRDEAELGLPVGRKRYSVFTATNPGALVDSHIVWTANANGAMSPARPLGVIRASGDQSGAGVLWRTECEEVL